MVRGSRVTISCGFKVEFCVEKKNSMEFLLGPITRRINVLYESRMKWTWHHSKLAVEEVSFFGGLESGTPSTIMEPTTVGSLWLENDLHENECLSVWIDLFKGLILSWAPKPVWKWTWIWILYGKIEKKCPRYFRRDSRGNPRDLNMCRTGRSAALSRGRKSMPPRRESMKLVVQQRKFT